MIKNHKKLEKFYGRLMAKEKLSYQKNLAIYESLHQEAVTLGIINSKNILDGFDIDLKIARAVNSLKPHD